MSSVKEERRYQLKPISKEYIRRLSVLILIALFAWMYYYYPLENYFYLLIFLAVLAYMFGPKAKIPDGAAYYSKILLLDIMGFAFWAGMVMFVLSMTAASHISLVGAVVVLMFFGIYPLYILWLSVKFSSRWYLFDDDVFRWSDADGVQSIALSDMVSAEPYVMKKYVASVAEMGIQIKTKLGKKIKIISNNLEADEKFMKRLRELYLEGNSTFAQYLKDGTYSEGDEMFYANLQELQEKMEENGKKMLD